MLYVVNESCVAMFVGDQEKQSKRNMKEALTHGHPHDACLHHHHHSHHVRDRLHNANTVKSLHATLGPAVSAVFCMSLLLTLTPP